MGPDEINDFERRTFAAWDRASLGDVRHASIRTTETAYGWLTSESATTLARARIYGEGLRLVGGRKGTRKGTKAS